MWDVLILIGWVLAVARVTRLIAMDRITENARIALVRRLGEAHMLNYLMNCMWCMSIWVGVMSMPVPVFMAHRSWAQAAVFALGASYITGMLSRLDDDDEVEIEITE
jgi:hypothetical protein